MVKYQKIDYLNILVQVLPEESYLRVSQSEWDTSICFVDSVRNDIFKKLGSMHWEKVRVFCMLRMWNMI